MLGVALGEIGMSLDDFDSLSLPEFSHVMEAYNHKVERDNKISWETARFMVMYFIQPYCTEPGNSFVFLYISGMANFCTGFIATICINTPSQVV